MGVVQMHVCYISQNGPQNYSDKYKDLNCSKITRLNKSFYRVPRKETRGDRDTKISGETKGPG